VPRLSQPADASGRAPERRFHRRTLVGAAAWLVSDDERHSAECVDVSMGGAQLLATASLPAGKLVRLELALGLDRGSVSIQCEIVRASATQLGLRFLALERASLEAILSLF
jgi:c-di-GMP-binding flagellar brake protein YcgR